MASSCFLMHTTNLNIIFFKKAILRFSKEKTKKLTFKQDQFYFSTTYRNDIIKNKEKRKEKKKKIKFT